MMKKNFIYSLCMLLCGAIFMSSCEDMIEIESDRVDYDMSTLTLNDTVYSVLGILKGVQGVMDRQVLLGELRGDLMVVNEAKAVTDVQKIARFEFDSDNKYLDIKDYYTIINNCNIYLARVDTTLERNNQKLMLREFVGVHSVRTWAYMQLAMNYGEVPFFDEPILTHSLAEEVMKRPMADMNTIATKLIETLLPYEDPKAYPMPAFSGLKYKTEMFFVPIRQLLADLYLWTGNYVEAAKYYQKLIVDNKYIAVDANVEWMDEEAKGTPVGTFEDIFSSTNAIQTIAVSTFSASSADGSVSELASVIAPQAQGEHMVQAAPGYIGLSKAQVYNYYKNENNKVTQAINPSDNMPGDLRYYQSVYSTRNFAENVVYEGVIGKFNLMASMYSNGVTTGIFSEYVDEIKLSRSIQIYLRYAEALAGIAANDSNWKGATELAMRVLKEGIKAEKYYLQKYLNDFEVSYMDVKKDDEGKIVYKYDENGDTLFILNDETGEKTYIPDSVLVTEVKQLFDTIEYDFTSFAALDENIGVHSRGSGNAEYNEYYSLSNDSCIALYFGKEAVDATKEIPLLNDKGKVQFDENGDTIMTTVAYKEYGITPEMKVDYVRNLIIDECALETAFEGYRFTDLIRFAKNMGNPDVLAKRVAGRAIENKVSSSHPDFQYDATLYEKLKNEANWYLPKK